MGGTAYLAVAGWDFPWNPMRVLVPKAYELSGLVAATVVVNVVIAFLFIVVSELAAARRERLLAVVSGLGALAQIVATTSAGITGAFARPIGLGSSNVVRLVGYGWGRARFYAAISADTADAPDSDTFAGGIHSPALSEGNGTDGNSGR
jgi:hypothetical protein